MVEVLIVDDDPDVRMLVSFALEDSGFSVRHASSGAEAIAALAEHPPDAMVLDVMMPEVDGFGVLRHRAQHHLAEDTRVLVLTCKADERDHARGLALGADDYATKPFDPECLVERVRWLLSTPRAELDAHREAELAKAALLERLEAAFARDLAARRLTTASDG